MSNNNQSYPVTPGGNTYPKLPDPRPFRDDDLFETEMLQHHNLQNSPLAFPSLLDNYHEEGGEQSPPPPLVTHKSSGGVGAQTSRFFHDDSSDLEIIGPSPPEGSDEGEPMRLQGIPEMRREQSLMGQVGEEIIGFASQNVREIQNPNSHSINPAKKIIEPKQSHYQTKNLTSGGNHNHIAFQQGFPAQTRYDLSPQTHLMQRDTDFMRQQNNSEVDPLRRDQATNLSQIRFSSNGKRERFQSGISSENLSAAFSPDTRMVANHHQPNLISHYAEISMSPFIANLYRSIEDQQHTDVINWSENGGQYFVIFSMEKFKSQVLPKYFTTTSYSTFVRQLNKYGFRKVNIKKDEHIFYHPVFKADNKASLHTIKRKRKTSGGQTSGGNSALLFSGASSVNLAAHREIESIGFHPNLETIQQKQVNYVYPLTKMSTNQDHSSHPMDLEGQILFPSGFNRSSGQIPKQNSISHQEADSPNNPPTPVSLGPQQNPESPLMREVNEPPPHHASLQRLELYNQGSDEYKADTPNHTHNYSGRGNYLQKYGENISDQSHHQDETDCLPKSDQSGFEAIAEHFQNLATQFERHNGQQQDLLKEIKTMEVSWKQENAKTAKNILNINKEMKEEVKKLRELVDAYGVPILRDATQIINDAGGKLARSGEITFRQQTTVIKELRSVNEQLHNDKQAIHQTMINWIQEQVASHPTTIHSVRAMFQDFIHQRQSNNFNEQITDSIRGITSPSNNRGDLQYCENSLSHQANAPKAHEELKQNSACFVSEHRYHPGDSLRSSLNPAFKQEAGNTQLGKRATKALDQKGVFKRAKRHSFSKFRKPQQQVDPSSSINSGDQQPKFDDSQQNARQGAQEFRQANPFTFQNNADNFTMQLTKLASENCAKENKLLQRLSSQFNLSSPVTSGTPRNHNELLSNHDSLHQQLTSSQMRQRALSLAQTSSNQLPIPLPLSMLTINQSSFDPLQQNLLPQGMVSKTISHLEPAFIPSAQVALAAQNLQRQGFTPSFRQNSGEGGLMQQGFMSYPPQSRWIPNQQQQQTTLQLPPLLPGPPSILNNNQHQSFLDESPSLQFQMRSQQRAAAAWGKRNTVLSQFTQKRKLTQ